MAWDAKAATPDTSLPSTGFLIGADSQAAAAPSIYSMQTVVTAILGSTSITGNTETTSKPLINLAQTWNAGAVTFESDVIDVTDSASAAASLILNRKVGGTSKFSVRKDGFVFTNASAGFVFTAATVGFISNVGQPTMTNTTANWLTMSSTQTYQSSSALFGWGNSATMGSATLDTILRRNAAAHITMGAADAASPVAQTISFQNVVAGNGNTAGATATIQGSLSNGSGGGDIVIKTTLSTAASGSQNTAQTALTVKGGTQAVLATAGFGSALGTLTDGATINWNAAAAGNGAVVQVTIAATGRTMAAPTNLTSGVFYTLFVKQDGTGSRTITTWDAIFVWPSGTAPTLTTTASKRDCFVFYYDGTNLINIGQTYNLA